MEITVLSAQGLKNMSSGPFSNRLRPFVTITTYPQIQFNDSDEKRRVYTSRIDDQGGVNPNWGDKFYVPIDSATFFANNYSCICLEFYSKRLIAGKVLLGWCQIPVTDIGFLPDNSARHLSYRIRDRDGSRGQGIVNVAIKLLTGFEQVNINNQLLSNVSVDHHHQEGSEDCRTVIGIPMKAFSHTGF
ncbi:BON1-associated protein 2-like [Mercurialis annua]|uniref:BON1-associated protein 2-like n=1 Tax=Mercurialis annua TaxID=3986 RepID=UPI002160EF7C|nr:BON1-associated protein 2-like [Mercurialis annua]